MAYYSGGSFPLLQNNFTPNKRKWFLEKLHQAKLEELRAREAAAAKNKR